MMRVTIVLALALGTISPALAQTDEEWEDWDDDAWSEADEAAWQWNGFVEGAAGTRWDEDPQVGRHQSLGDLRLRVETERLIGPVTASLKADAWYDQYLSEFDGNLRELAASFRAGSWDFRIGQQVLTWGTGDLLFLNDLFPKDWEGFFAGRSDEYLKAPSAAVRATWYTDVVNADFVWTPVFEPDVYLDGERFSFFAPLAGQRVAPDPPLNGLEPDERLSNGEFALRLFRTIRGTEYAIYAYRGFFHQPNALDAQLRPTFAPLSALGASFRRAAFSGLLNAEAVYYASRDDRAGSDPFVPNDQWRVLVGYERELVARLNLGVQYYAERTLDHDALVANSPVPQFEPDSYRYLLTSRLTYRAMLDKLTLSLFVFYSPSDDDHYARPVVEYRFSDQWAFAAGMNLFGGDEAHTFFNQFSDNDNVYLRARFSF